MDPSYVTTEIWHDLSTVLRFFWVYILFIIVFAANFLLAHAIIPSLVSTGHLPQSFNRVRPLIYIGAFGILTVALLFVVLTLLNIGVIGEVWGRWWI